MKLEMSEKELVIALIKDDLINTRLINGLNSIGLNSDGYLLHLSETIFKLIGIGNDEEGQKVFKWYWNFRQNVNSIDISESSKSLDSLALEIYLELLLERVLYLHNR